MRLRDISREIEDSIGPRAKSVHRYSSNFQRAIDRELREITKSNECVRFTELPPQLLQDLVSRGLLTQIEHYNKIREEIIRTSRGINKIHHQWAKFERNSTKTLAAQIYHFTLVWEGDTTTTDRAFGLFRALIRLLDLVHTGLCSRLACCSTTRWTDLEDNLIKTLAHRCASIKQEIESELEKAAPTWKSDWLSFKNVLGTMAKNQDGRPTNIGLMSNVLAFISHIMANLELYWQLELSLRERGLPKEIRSEIFRYTLEAKSIRQLPATDFDAHVRFRTLRWIEQPNVKYSCPACTKLCNLSQESVLLIKPLAWQVEILHTQKHDGDCSCPYPVSPHSKYMRRSGQYIANLDPAGIFAPMQSMALYTDKESDNEENYGNEGIADIEFDSDDRRGRGR